MKQCPNCNKQLEEGSIYCIECGQKLGLTLEEKSHHDMETVKDLKEEEINKEQEKKSKLHGILALVFFCLTWVVFTCLISNFMLSSLELSHGPIILLEILTAGCYITSIVLTIVGLVENSKNKLLKALMWVIVGVTIFVVICFIIMHSCALGCDCFYDSLTSLE